jgi:hypothetical protein
MVNKAEPKTSDKKGGKGGKNEKPSPVTMIQQITEIF